MYKKQKIFVAVIPARVGSKEIKKKNIAKVSTIERKIIREEISKISEIEDRIRNANLYSLFIIIGLASCMPRKSKLNFFRSIVLIEKLLLGFMWINAGLL